MPASPTSPRSPAWRARCAREGRPDDCRRGPHVGWDLPGCLSDVAAVPASGLVEIPDGVSDQEGACLQPAADCVAALEAARIEPGARVAVVGQGPMGGHALQLARIAGAAHVVAIDVRAEPLAVARDVGADVCIDGSRDDVVEAVRELTAGRGVDVVIESAGGPGLMPLDVLRWRSRAVELIFPPLGAPRHMRRAAELVATGELALTACISHTVTGLERVPEAFEITADKARHGALGPCQALIGGAS